MNEDLLAIGGFFTTVIVLGLGIPLVRAYVKSRERRMELPPVNPENDRRLERIEAAVESMAIEIERISEGQRFTTKLLSERADRGAAAMLGAAPPPKGEVH
jgi:hypothetical protein